MKPPVDWSPCQQKGEEHEWNHNTLAFNIKTWICIKCGVIVFDDSFRGYEGEFSW